MPTPFLTGEQWFLSQFYNLGSTLVRIHHFFKSQNLRIKCHESLRLVQAVNVIRLSEKLCCISLDNWTSGATRSSRTTGGIASHQRHLEFVSKVVERGPPCQAVHFVRVAQLLKLRLISDTSNPQVESLVYSFLKVMGTRFSLASKI